MSALITESIKQLEEQQKILQEKLAEQRAKQIRKVNTDVLVPTSPSPKKKPEVPLVFIRDELPKMKSLAPKTCIKPVLEPTPSAMLQSLQTLKSTRKHLENKPKMQRSEGFTQLNSPVEELPVKPTRHEDNTVIELIPRGPVDHKVPTDDPNFDLLEPNSGTVLLPNSRVISHEEVQEHLSQRFILSPSVLYSVARKPVNLPSSSATLEVDIEGDFVVMGVIAWKDEVRVVQSQYNTPAPKKKEDNKWDDVKGVREEQEDEESNKKESEAVPGETPQKPFNNRPMRRYIRFVITDLSTEAASSAGTGTLNMMLWESEQTFTFEDEYGVSHQTYKGGSGGAYEKFWKAKLGSVVAILNPKVTRPSAKPYRGVVSNVLSISPGNEDAVIVIGTAKYLGHCTAFKANGSVCADWLDTRSGTGKFCHYHISRQVKQTGSRRAETYSSTSSMATTTSFNRKSFSNSLRSGPEPRANIFKETKFDPVKKQGLLPDHKVKEMVEGTRTYVVSGNKKSFGSQQLALKRKSLPTYSSKKLIPGIHEGPTLKEAERESLDYEIRRATRKKETKSILQHDNGSTIGSQYLIASKEQRAKDRAKRKLELEQEREDDNRNPLQQPKKRKRVGVAGPGELSSDDEEPESNDIKEKRKQDRASRRFPQSAVRLIGFDPTETLDQVMDQDAENKKVDDIEKLLTSARTTPISFSPRKKPVKKTMAPPPSSDDLDILP